MISIRPLCIHQTNSSDAEYASAFIFLGGSSRGNAWAWHVLYNMTAWLHYVCVCVCVHVWVCVSMCVCVCRQRGCLCVRVCVCWRGSVCQQSGWDRQRNRGNKTTRVCVCLLFHFSLNTSVHVSASQQDAARSVALSRMRSVAHGSVLWCFEIWRQRLVALLSPLHYPFSVGCIYIQKILCRYMYLYIHILYIYKYVLYTYIHIYIYI